MSTRAKVYAALHGRDGEGLTVTQRCVMAAILAGVALAIIGTEPALPPGWQQGIDHAEVVMGVIFLVEYVARVWSIGEQPEHAGLAGRLRYMAKPFAVIDLLALLPYLLGFMGSESFVLRVIRVLRLLAISKMIRYSEAMRIVVGAVIERKFELMFAVMLAWLMILVASAALYVVEGDKQPEVFGSILRSMWWAVVTLTTVGYGDVVPQTVLGKIFAGATALAGIGMIAMPTGILAASFSDGFARARARADVQAGAVKDER
jgi:voltage-gated potassium channel